MSDMTSIKIASSVKDQLNHLKLHPRETYSDLIGRLAELGTHPQQQIPFIIPLMHVKINQKIIELKEPVEITVEMDEDEYILFNHEYRLLVVASHVYDGMKDILDEFEENWKDFVLGDENAMGRDSLELREKFSAIVPSESSS
ncbi:MAG: hypothetical protein BWY45_02754 [Euryarchaeota archaeon ADurb.Bin294]|nr:MAG: hypothetical protein BWY45_02754 [Euryarchaeota archaeon ADurb.Bin294]